MEHLDRSGTQTDSSLAAAPERKSVISVRNVSLWFEKFRALTDVSFDVDAGEFVSIVGPTGCGKSSLLNLIAGLLEPSEGSVKTFDKEVLGINPDCGYMFQNESLMPWRKVVDNVMLGPMLHGKNKKEARAAAADWLARVGLAKFHDRYPANLSGGQRKRVAMAQVLINEPEIILMDEPFGALDAQTRTLMGNELLTLWARSKATVLFVTHDLEEAIALSDRVILLTSGPEAGVKSEYQIDIPRPRDVTNVRVDPIFREIYKTVWADLREEVMTAYEQSAGVQ